MLESQLTETWSSGRMSASGMIRSSDNPISMSISISMFMAAMVEVCSSVGGLICCGG